MSLGFKKIMFEVQGNFFDLWHLVSAEKEEEYNDKTNEMEYRIILNRSVVSREFRDVVIKYSSQEERDKELDGIRQMLARSPFIFFANDLQDDENLEIVKRKNKGKQKIEDEEEPDLEF